MENITIKAHIEGLGEREITLNLDDILQHLKPEHFGSRCPQNHTEQEILSMVQGEVFCEICDGTGFVVTHAGQAILPAITKHSIANEIRVVKNIRER